MYMSVTTFPPLDIPSTMWNADNLVIMAGVGFTFVLTIDEAQALSAAITQALVDRMVHQSKEENK